MIFLIYSKKLKFFLFADDTNIYMDSDKLAHLETTMNKELVKLYEWLCLNRLSLNISKTNFLIFTPSNKPKSTTTLLINKTAIKEEQYVKYLGLLIDSQLTFKCHIEELKKKISRTIGVLHKLKPFVTSTILTNVYYAIVYPFLLYGIIIWGNSSKTLLSSIHILQKRFVRLATNNSTTNGYLTHSLPLFRKLNILTIYDIYKLQLGALMYESQNNLGPINNIISVALAREVHTHNTRYALNGNLHIRSVRTTRYGLKSLQNEGARLWTDIPPLIKSKSSKISFKTHFKNFLLTKYD